MKNFVREISNIYQALNHRFSCICPDGFVWDRSGTIPQCVNQNECNASSTACDASAECEVAINFPDVVRVESWLF